MSVASTWSSRYSDLAGRIDATPATGPFLSGFSACVDAIWAVDADLLRRMAVAATDPANGPAADLLDRALSRIARGHGGELFLGWAEAQQWLQSFLPPPQPLQVGGTSPQTAWTLAQLGNRWRQRPVRRPCEAGCPPRRCGTR